MACSKILIHQYFCPALPDVEAEEGKKVGRDGLARLMKKLKRKRRRAETDWPGQTSMQGARTVHKSAISLVNKL